MEIILPAAVLGTGIYLGYISMTPEAVNKTLARDEIPIVEQSEWFAFTSENNVFNPAKVPVEGWIGQFGLPEIFIADGKGCMTRLSDVGIGTATW